MKASGRKLFGTDGIRGTVGVDLTSQLAAQVGAAVAVASRRGVLGDAAERPKIVIARDTRPSGLELEQAFVEGARAAGADIKLAGVLPTAAVAYLTAHLGFDAGVVISASHNPPADNGIKLFGPGGWKLSAAAEATIEDLVGNGDVDVAVGKGAIAELSDAQETYISHLISAASHDLLGLRVVVDCANGAASGVAPEVFRRLGVEVVAMNGDPDGSLINEGCGALHPELVATAARREQAIGITFDGDADRVLFSDENGRLVGGDGIIALVATRMKHEGALANDTIVVTVMANQALREWSAAQQISIVETAVGDRYVLEAMQASGAMLGGEQSGHIICLDRSTTGDGILVALEVLDLVAEAGKPLADLVPFEPFPQVLVNVKTGSRERVSEMDGVRRAISDAEGRLGPHGRVLVRPSGTEPLVRVMVEAPDAALADDVAEHVASAVRRELNGEP